MNLSEFQTKARTTAIYIKIPNTKMIYPALGLIGECGEVAEKVKKLIRDDDSVMSQSRATAIKKELGDCMWYCASVCSDTGHDLETLYASRKHVLIQQIEKLSLPRIVIRMHHRASAVALELDNWVHRKLAEKYSAIPYNLSSVITCIETIAIILGSNLEEVCDENIAKLTSRKNRGTLSGEGDDR